LAAIAAGGRRSRVVLVLPPPDHETNVHERSCRRAGEILAALGLDPASSFATYGQNPEPWQVHLRRERVLLVDVRAAGEGDGSTLEAPICLTADQRSWQRPDLFLGAQFYQDALTGVLHEFEKVERVPRRAGGAGRASRGRRVRRRPPHTVLGGDRAHVRWPGGQGPRIRRVAPDSGNPVSQLPAESRWIS
jgi:hypothetical protein